MGREINTTEDLLDVLDNLDEESKEDLEKIADKLYNISLSIKSDLSGLPRRIVEGQMLIGMNRRCQEEVNKVYGEKNTLNQFMNDVYHIYGLASIGATDMMEIASIFSKKLKKRFKVKDKCELLKMLNGVLKKHEDFFDELEHVMNKIRHKKISFDKREYIPRTQLGKELVEKYSKEGDDLKTGVDDEKIKELEDSLNSGLG